ncbi:MAG: MBL fold metallo-hydrolase [Gemmatimonadota bacterium]
MYIHTMTRRRLAGFALAAALGSLVALPRPLLGQTGRAALPTPERLPAGFTPPPLHPAGATLTTTRLAPGVYALLSDRPPVDNSGFIVGETGVLVVDAHINGDMAGQIIRAVREVTDKPILYLVNTNYHGDHTFGNYAFPADTRVVAHRATAGEMRNFEAEKRFLLVTVEGDSMVYGDVRLRLPDLVFEDFLRLDLGGRVVELHHFGPGNTEGDIVVWVPEARVAWTGNLVLGGGLIPFLIEGGPERYRATIRAFRSALDVETIVPGHGPLVTGEVLAVYEEYLAELRDTVRSAAAEGWSLDALLERPLDPRYLPAAIGFEPFARGLHRFNLAAAYRGIDGSR